MASPSKSSGAAPRTQVPKPTPGGDMQPADAGTPKSGNAGTPAASTRAARSSTTARKGNP